MAMKLVATLDRTSQFSILVQRLGSPQMASAAAMGTRKGAIHLSPELDGRNGLREGPFTASSAPNRAHSSTVASVSRRRAA